MYTLDYEEKWPLTGSLNYYIIIQLELFCQQPGKLNNVPYVQAFMSLRNKGLTKKGNNLIMQRRELASTYLPDNKTQEEK